MTSMSVDDRVAAAKNLLGPIGLLVLSYEQSIQRADGGRGVYAIALERMTSSIQDGSGPRTIIPTAIKIVCPRCGEQVTVSLKSIHRDTDRRIAMCEGTCSNYQCQGLITCLALSENGKLSHLAIYPMPTHSREPDATLLARPVPRYLSTLYSEAVGLYNTGYWRQCATTCRLVMEGCINALDDQPPELADASKRTGRKATFNDRINEAGADTPWAVLVRNQAHGIREAGNMGAHFERKSPTQQNAAASLDLVAGMLRFVFVYPARLKALLAGLRRAQNVNPPGPPP